MECHSAIRMDVPVRHTMGGGRSLKWIMPSERSQTKAHVVRVFEAPGKANQYTVSEGKSAVARTQGTVQERRHQRTRKLLGVTEMF